jgi:hypothetical protein
MDMIRTQVVQDRAAAAGAHGQRDQELLADAGAEARQAAQLRRQQPPLQGRHDLPLDAAARRAVPAASTPPRRWRAIAYLCSNNGHPRRCLLRREEHEQLPRPLPRRHAQLVVLGLVVAHVRRVPGGAPSPAQQRRRCRRGLLLDDDTGRGRPRVLVRHAGPHGLGAGLLGQQPVEPRRHLEGAVASSTFYYIYYKPACYCIRYCSI